MAEFWHWIEKCVLLFKFAINNGKYECRTLFKVREYKWKDLKLTSAWKSYHLLYLLSLSYWNQTASLICLFFQSKWNSLLSMKYWQGILHMLRRKQNYDFNIWIHLPCFSHGKITKYFSYFSWNLQEILVFCYSYFLVTSAKVDRNIDILRRCYNSVFASQLLPKTTW